MCTTTQFNILLVEYKTISFDGIAKRIVHSFDSIIIENCQIKWVEWFVYSTIEKSKSNCFPFILANLIMSHNVFLEHLMHSLQNDICIKYSLFYCCVMHWSISNFYCSHDINKTKQNKSKIVLMSMRMISNNFDVCLKYHWFIITFIT